jgi:hypothetical protein
MAKHHSKLIQASSPGWESNHIKPQNWKQQKSLWSKSRRFEKKHSQYSGEQQKTWHSFMMYIEGKIQHLRLGIRYGWIQETSKQLVQQRSWMTSGSALFLFSRSSLKMLIN